MLNPFKIQDRFSVIQMLVGGHITYHADDDIIYHDGQTPPTEKEITDKMAEIQAEYTSQEYARNREGENPSSGDQWDMIYKDMKNSTTTQADAVEAVKTKWPKDNSGPVE